MLPRTHSAIQSVSFNSPPKRSLGDILSAIVLIEDFTSGMDFETFRSSPMAVAAVERELLIVSEAAIRLGAEAERMCPDQPWPDIRGLGNRIRHAYDRIEIDRIWNTVTEHLPPLKASVQRALAG